MKIEQLTFLRFVAASIVVLFHYGRSFPLAKSFPALFSGPAMVPLFFVLSGFVLTIAYEKQVSVGVRDFLYRRMARILPAYLLALAIMVAYAKAVETKALVFNLLLLQSWFPPYGATLNYPAWSLSVEFFFYALFPFAFLILRNVGWLRFGVAALLAWALSQAVLEHLLGSSFYQKFPSPSHDLIFYFPLSHLTSFTLGMAFAALYLAHGTFFERRRWLVLLAMVCSAGLIVMVLNRDLNIGRNVSLGGLAPFFGILFLALAADSTWVSRILRWWPLVLLGEASYAMYIMQIPAWQLFVRYLPVATLEPDQKAYLFLVFLTFLSIVIFTLFERPVRGLLLRVWTIRKRVEHENTSFAG